MPKEELGELIAVGQESFLTQLLQVHHVASDWYFIAEQPAAAPHLARPEGCAALRIVLPKEELGELMAVGQESFLTQLLQV